MRRGRRRLPSQTTSRLARRPVTQERFDLHACRSPTSSSHRSTSSATQSADLPPYFTVLEPVRSTQAIFAATMLHLARLPLRGALHGLRAQEGVQLLGRRWRGVGHALVRGRARPAAAALGRRRRDGDDAATTSATSQCCRRCAACRALPATPTRGTCGHFPLECDTRGKPIVAAGCGRSRSQKDNLPLARVAARRGGAARLAVGRPVDQHARTRRARRSAARALGRRCIGTAIHRVAPRTRRSRLLLLCG